MSTPPIFQFTVKRRFTIQFSGAVGAGPGVGQTLVAGPITIPFRIVGAEIVFRDDANNLVQVYLLLSRDTTTSATTPPADTNIFGLWSPTANFIGEGLVKRVECSFEAEEDQKYLKVHALNGCAYQQTINASIEIEEI